MRTLDLNDSYDLHLDARNNLAVQRDNLSVIRQTIVNKLSLIKGEDVYDENNGLNLDIIFGDNVSYNTKISEIRRVILLDQHVVSVDDIKMEVNPSTRVGYFTCYITVAVDDEEVNTTIKFGV